VTRIGGGPAMHGVNTSTGQPVWFVEGVAYLDDAHPFVRLAHSRPGAYAVTVVDQAPADYLDAVDRMRQRSHQTMPAVG
jgi:hypothetical protein